MKLALAEALAQKIIGTMQPFCERVEVGGSTRRRKAEVKDLEIIAIPKYEGHTDLFNEHPRNLLYTWAKQMEAENRIQWMMTGTHEIKPCNINPDGKHWRGLLLATGLKLDLFLTAPERWGATFLIRTGSSDFNIQMIYRAQTCGYRFDNGEFCDRFGVPVATPEEHDIFTALGLDFIEPIQRTGARLW